MVTKFQRKKSTPPTRLSLSIQALRSLGSPTRLAIIGALRALGPSSIRELAVYLERPADGLYYHVRNLERAGLVEVVEKRRVWRRFEALYRPTADIFEHSPLVTSSRYRSATARSNRAVLTLAHRHYANALRAVPAEPELETMMEYYIANARLTTESARALREKIRNLFDEVVRDEGVLGRRVAVTVVMTPVVSARRGRKKSGKPARRRVASSTRRHDK